MHITPELIKKFNVEGPRYTSYPTAPIWHNDFTAQQYLAVLASSLEQYISLYIHIPFCAKLCFYCACNISIREQDEKVGDEYLDYLALEMQLVTSSLGYKPRVKQIHLGGGTPTFLTNKQLARLDSLVKQYFALDLEEYAIEIDPRTVDRNKLTQLKQLGFNRLSFGIQDFNPQVQRAIKREHSFEQVQELLGITREIGFNAINIDLIYGLPHQTLTSFAKTIEQVIQLLPERIALYSYAYVPWIHKHQTAMDQSTMGDADSKMALFLQAREQFIASDYCAIAMDHFALADDEIAKAYNSGTIRRNFMGYTTLATESYIGLGVSAIGYIGNSFIQNHKSLKQYYTTLDTRQLPTARGYQLHSDDLLRQWVISSLMCKFVVDKIEFKEKFSLEFDSYFASELAAIKEYVAQEMITIEENNIQVLAKGKCFVRNICMHFDAYLVKQSHTQQFSKTV